MADFGVGRVRILVFLGMLGLAGQHVAAQNPPPAEVLASLPRFLDAGSGEEIVSLCAEDIVWVNPDARGVLSGKAAVRGHVAELLGKFKSVGSTLKVEHSQVSGEWATVVASFHASWTGRDGQKVEERSRWVSVLRRAEGGAWQLSRMVWFPLTE